MDFLSSLRNSVFQLRDHEDVLESGTDRASDVQQDHSDGTEVNWGRARAGTGELVSSPVQPVCRSHHVSEPPQIHSNSQ